MRDQVEKKGESEEAKAEARTGKTAVRWNREEKERKKQRPSSEVLKRKWTKESGSQATVPKEKSEGNHLWNGCGSEAGENERKPSEKPSMRTREECMRNQAGKNGETQEVRTEGGHRGSNCEAEAGRTERKKQKAE